MASKVKATTLGHSLEIYIPTQCRCGKLLPEHARAEILDEVKTTMAGWFGGNSAKKVDPRVERIEGSWILGDGNLAKEPIDVVQSFTDEDTLIDQRDDFTAYVAQLANRLTQEQMLCRIDGKSILYPSAADTKPHRCAGGVTSAATPKPRESGELGRMMALQAGLQRLGSANDVRDLFCNVLHYEYENGIVPTTGWPDSVKQCLAPGVAPQIIADQNGFKIIYLQLADGSLRKSHERQLVQRLIKENPGMRGLIVVSDVDQKHWNLVNVKFDRDGKKLDNVLLRRMRVGPGQPVRTAVERLSQVDIETAGEDATAAELQDLHDKAFDVAAVTKQFFSDVANWYFWALKHAEFPKDAPKEDDGHDHVSLIRLITRLIFCWFLREKGLLPDTLFDRRQLNGILEGFAPDKVRNKDSVFYRAILQNLFFATLSTETDKRKWATDEQNFMAHSLYRFKECFQKPATALNLFKSIPFLNGGLFECLDRDLGEGKKPRYIRIDGFSRRSDSQPVVPDFLFFGPEKEIDLSEEYGGDRRFRSVRVRGLIDTLRHYNFTIEENTPIEEEVALDPELCGMVFENLLAAYNPETGTTARKQSGSFYTPREIVNYMVDEALIASLTTKLEAAIPVAKEVEPRMRHLFAYNDEPHQFTPKEVTALIAAIDTLKTLDPAVGSGAFPMGMLHKLVFILGKLDLRNEQWKERQIARVREAIAVAEKIEDDGIRSRTIEDLEQQVVNIEESFDRNELNYGRKLYLIENCIYGVDIQPIAVQIAKMRFFISLIVDQKIDDSLPNRGVRPLPNLETKFVAANTLIGIDRPGQQFLRNRVIDSKEAELRRVRERHFLARAPKQKSKCRDEDAKLRSAIASLLKDDGWDTVTARKLASWNPYDQNSSAEFFDAEWMFGITDGFDICEANPPYVLLQGGNRDAGLNEYFRKRYQVASYKLDLYHLFIECGVNLLKKGGVICYITPSNFVSNNYTVNLRRFLLTKTILEKLVFFDDSVFDASVHNLVFVARKDEDSNSKTSFYKAQIESGALCLEAKSQVQQSSLVNDMCLLVLSSGTAADSVISKLSQAGNTFGSVASINFGMQLRDRSDYPGDVIESPPNKSTLTKFHRECYAGKDVHRFYVSFSNRFCNFNRVAKRGGCWDEKIHTVKNKILVRQIGEFPEGGLDTRGHAVLNAAFMIFPKINGIDPCFLLGVLNSKATRFYWLNKFRDDRKTFPKIKGEYLKLLPLPKATLAQQQTISQRVEKIVAAKTLNPSADTASMEREIDRLVFSLFNLTSAEIVIIEELLEK